jgi:predicted nucleic acid-binding protein
MRKDEFRFGGPRVRTAVDTNIFVALFAGDEQATPAARYALEGASERGSLVVSPAVYAELVAGWSPDAVETFFDEKRIEVDWDLGREVWLTAGSRYGEYALSRERRRGDSAPRRILADFVIGAHALHRTAALLTLDRGVYAAAFPDLELLAPELA